MTAIEIPVAELIPYINNPRINDKAVPAVAESIRQFGFKQPLVVDKNNVIIVGHTRLKAAKLLGLKTVPCVRADDLTDDEARAYRLVDNKVLIWKTGIHMFPESKSGCCVAISDTC